MEKPRCALWLFCFDWLSQRARYFTPTIELTMAKLTLSDLSTLVSLPQDDSSPLETPKPKKLGYDGKPIILKVKLDKGGRKGRIVTLITGFQSNPQVLERMCKELKNKCGAGGNVIDNSIEIQGDHKKKVVPYFTEMGYNVKEQ